jgi:hypothetical protein
MLVKIQGNRNSHALLVGMQISTTTMKSCMDIPQKVNVELPNDPVIPPLGIHPMKCKLDYNRDTCSLMFITALYTIAKL